MLKPKKKIKPTTAETPVKLAQALGLQPSDAKEWAIQHDLLKQIKKVVALNKFTHEEIAKKVGTSRTRITSILNNNLKNVSSDLLIRILWHLGYDVKINVTKSRKRA
jgi:predicted XRE-type DNA-binding protein